MKAELPRSIFNRLSTPQMAVANALAHRARVQYWLGRARDDQDLRSTCVAYARSAHRAYLKDVKRAVTYARWRI